MNLLATHTAINSLLTGLLSLASQTKYELFLSVPTTSGFDQVQSADPEIAVLLHYDAGDAVYNPEGLLKQIAHNLEMTRENLALLPFISLLPRLRADQPTAS